MADPARPEPSRFAAFRVEITHERDDVVVAVHGELDLTTRHRLLAAVAELRALDHPHIVLDLRPLDFIDASGMGAIRHLTRTTRVCSSHLSIVPGGPSIMRTFALAGLADRLPFTTLPPGSGARALAGAFVRPRGAERPPDAPHIDAEPVAEQAGCLLMVLDPDGRIGFFNHHCEEVSGYTADQALGRRPWELFLPPEEVERYRQTYARLLNTPLPDGYVTWWQHRDGDRRLVRWTNTSLVDAADSPILITGIEAGVLQPADRR